MKSGLRQHHMMFCQQLTKVRYKNAKYKQVYTVSGRTTFHKGVHTWRISSWLVSLLGNCCRRRICSILQLIAEYDGVPQLLVNGKAQGN